MKPRIHRHAMAVTAVHVLQGVHTFSSPINVGWCFIHTVLANGRLLKEINKMVPRVKATMQHCYASV